jgi:hypothetical protein
MASKTAHQYQRSISSSAGDNHARKSKIMASSIASDYRAIARNKYNGMKVKSSSAYRRKAGVNGEKQYLRAWHLSVMAAANVIANGGGVKARSMVINRRWREKCQWRINGVAAISAAYQSIMNWRRK